MYDIYLINHCKDQSQRYSTYLRRYHQLNNDNCKNNYYTVFKVTLNNIKMQSKYTEVLIKSYEIWMVYIWLIIVKIITTISNVFKKIPSIE